MSISSLWLFLAAQRKSRDAPVLVNAGPNKPADRDDKTALKQSVEQNNEKKMKNPEDEKKDQEEVKPVAAGNTENKEETKFNVRKVCSCDGRRIEWFLFFSL